MITKNECLSLRSSITSIITLENSLVAIVSMYHGLRILSLDENQVVGKFSHKLLSGKTRDIAISKDGIFLALANREDKNIHLFQLSSNKLIKSIKTPNEISKLEFDSSSRYLFASTNTGRVLQYKYDNSTLLARVCSFVSNKSRQSYVSVLTLHKHLLATSGFGNKIFIINTHSNAKFTLTSYSKARINTIVFSSDTTIISANIDGMIELFNIGHNEAFEKIETHFRNISQILLLDGGDYLLINNNEKNLALLNLKTKKVINQKYIAMDEKISTIKLHGSNNLIIGLENGSTINVELPNTQLLKKYINSSKYEEAYDMLSHAQMLKTSQEYKKLEEIYSKALHKCVEALSKQNITLARESVANFANISTKKDEIKSLFKAFDHYKRLQALYLEKKFALAFALCNKFEPLKHTFQYKKMDEAWINHFKDAQRQLLIGRFEDAKSILMQYNTVISKRELVQHVLREHKIFTLFVKAIETNDTNKIEKILTRDPIFATAPTYTPFEYDYESKIQEIEQHLLDSKLSAAKKEILQLRENYKNVEVINELIKKLNTFSILLQAYNNDELYKCFEMIDSNIYLLESKISTLVENHWQNIVIQAEDFALKGDIKNIKKVFGNLLTLQKRSEKTGSILRVCFNIKIKQLISKKSYKNAENMIYTYIDIFGLDKEMFTLMKQFEVVSKLKLAMTQEQNKRPPRDAWLNSKLVKE